MLGEDPPEGRLKPGACGETPEAETGVLGAEMFTVEACLAALEPSLPAEVSDDARHRLASFAARLGLANRRTNLTAARTPEAIAEHIADSLRLRPLLVSPFVDVGSGGGFPALPLAVVTGARALLVESVGKKARFLIEAARALALDVEVVTGRAETVGHDPSHRERYASATARAVGAPTVVLELTMPLLAVGGRALLQRGATSAAERNALADAALVLGGRIVEEIRGEGERRIFVVRKERSTGRRFPRRSGIPERKPLCAPVPA